MIATSKGDLLRRVVFDYLRYGYTRIATIEIPETKATEEELVRIDRKIETDYRVTYHRPTRIRRREKGEASIVHVRWRRWFVLLATPGRHEQEGRISWHDVKEKPFHLFGYSLGIGRDGKPTVFIVRRTWERIRRIGGVVALRDTQEVERFAAWIEKVIAFDVPSVVKQKEKLRRAINDQRRAAGLPIVGKTRNSLY